MGIRGWDGIKICVFIIPAAMKEAKPRLAIFFKYAKVELAPPTPGDIPKAFTGMRDIMSAWRTGRYKQLTVKVHINILHFSIIYSLRLRIKV